MREELTTTQHAEFTISDETRKRHDAYAVFQLVSDRISLDKALGYLQMTKDEVRPYVAGWNTSSAFPIIVD